LPPFLESVRCQPHLATLHREAIERAKPGGLFLEFGVGHGTSLAMLRGILPVSETIYGFDSFRGLPEPWAGYPIGTFSTGGVGPRLPNAEIVAGWFTDTVAPFVEQHAGEFVSYMHIDCDLYSSTLTVLTRLDRLIVPGTVIVFDELFGYDGWPEHEFRALTEWKASSLRSTVYILRDAHQRAAILIR
jgi:hypothetical protein